MKAKNHPFYCYKKCCPKTAWATPEYLSAEDWALVARVIQILDKKEGALALMNALYDDAELGRGFFYRAIGWAEGFSYCRDYQYVVKTAIPMLQNHLSLYLLQRAYDIYAPKT